MINNKTYRGDVIADDVYDAICAGFSEDGTPSVCKSASSKSDGITGV
jgi:hypothetical protein